MAFKIAVSGLQAASAELDVTGNNIANSNTNGFKSSRAQFADIYAVSQLGSSRTAIGQGVQIGSVSQQFSQGNVSFTDNNMDLAVNGEGFFVLEDSGTRVYSRAGAFGVDKDGYVVNDSGHNLIAFSASNGAITGAVSPLQLSTANLSPQPTSSLNVGVNLDPGASAPTAAFSPSDPASYNNSTSISVFDSLGQDHLASMYFRKTAANTWETHLRVDNDDTQTLANQTLTFDTTGTLTSAMPVGYGSYTPITGAADFTLGLDFGSSTQVGSGFGVNSLTQDGYTSGQLSGVDIDVDGIVLARFSNGQTEAQGQVVLANFANAQGLQPVSRSNWAETNASGAPLQGAPGTASLGLIQSGALEESNVDLSAELVNMIVAQRNFQANAQMIRAEDEVTQTIINIR